VIQWITKVKLAKRRPDPCERGGKNRAGAGFPKGEGTKQV
jgi:hypothetical protein